MYMAVILIVWGVTFTQIIEKDAEREKRVLLFLRYKAVGIMTYNSYLVKCISRVIYVIWYTNQHNTKGTISNSKFDREKSIISRSEEKIGHLSFLSIQFCVVVMNYLVKNIDIKRLALCLNLIVRITHRTVAVPLFVFTFSFGIDVCYTIPCSSWNWKL